MSTNKARQVLRVPASYTTAQAATFAERQLRHIVVGAPLRYSVACKTLMAAA